MYYVAVDIGCIECGEPSHVLGIFTNKEKALNVCKEHEERQNLNWTGQHSFEIFEIKNMGLEIKYSKNK